jgi:hypothetical protein
VPFVVPDTYRQEAVEFSRYLISEDPTPAEVDRYARACERLGLGESRADPLLAACMRHPSWVGLLDGACALMEPHHPLRRKLAVLTAILEASPEHVESFLPPSGGRLRCLLVLATSTILAGFRATLGLPLLISLRRMRKAP